MNNAVRHAEGTLIEVQCSVHPPRAEIVVSDDGRGIRSRREDSHGLEIMAERARLVEGRLNVESFPPGPVVTVTAWWPPGGELPAIPPGQEDVSRPKHRVTSQAAARSSGSWGVSCSHDPHLLQGGLHERLLDRRHGSARRPGPPRRRPRADPPGPRPRLRADPSAMTSSARPGASARPCQPGRSSSARRRGDRPPAARRHRLDIIRAIRAAERHSRPGDAHHALRRRPDLRRHGGRRLGVRRQGRPAPRTWSTPPRHAACRRALHVRRAGRRDDAPGLGDRHALSEREQEVLELLAEGLGTGAIASSST